MRPEAPGSGAATAAHGIESLARQLREAQRAQHARFMQDRQAMRLLRQRSRSCDQVIRSLWHSARLPASLLLLAVGGYGRQELYPGSDIDLLFLLPADIAPQTQARLETLVGQLWDTGLKISHSMRSLAQCIEQAEQDITVQTNLLDARRICGSTSRYRALHEALRAQRDPARFFLAKQEEQRQRHQRFQNTPYALEPHCKDAPGGLRDLQTARWMAQVAGLGRSWPQLVQAGILTAAEARQLTRLEGFLRDVRCRLHLLAQRGEDRLLFDHQAALAEQFGIAARGERRAAEVFMQRYYRSVKSVHQLNTLLLQILADRILPKSAAPARPLDRHFRILEGRLDLLDENLFQRQPARILECFLLWSRHPEIEELSANTLRALWRARRLVGADFRRQADNRARFLALFREGRGLPRSLQCMNDQDLLGRYLPAFGRIVCQMQHDLFHAYTVDQHILTVIARLQQLADEPLQYPLCSQLHEQLEKPEQLHLAALFHDIGKGRGGDHSHHGMIEARRFCRAHGLSPDETREIAWLVEHHLDLSITAQKQDLNDPAIVRDFALRVGTRERLVALFLLTVADIQSTSPGLWNSWKRKLLEELFQASLEVLQGDLRDRPRIGQQRRADARRLLRFHGLRPETESAFWETLGAEYFLQHDADEICWHTRILYPRYTTEHPIVRARVHRIGSEGLQVLVHATDQPRLFARLCGFFSRLGYSIVDARIYTTRLGFALDSFTLLDDQGRFASRDVIGLIEYQLTHILETGETLVPEDSARLPRRVRHFPLEPKIRITAEENSSRHQLTVVATDRPGLLYSIAGVLDEYGVAVHSARITTLGSRAEDLFLISHAQLAAAEFRNRLEARLIGELRIPPAAA